MKNIRIESLEQNNPELAKEWHPTKNGSLKPSDVTIGSREKVWWLLPYDDPITGRHFDFEWQAAINERIRGTGCPFLSGRAVYKGFNDLETRNPELVKEWHPTKNGNLKPSDVTISSGKKVWWLLSYDDPKTGKHFDFEWQATISSRKKGNKCPFLSSTNPKVWKGFNDLGTVNPKLAEEWHPTKNGNLKPSDVTSGAHQKVWWLFSYDDPKTGKHFDFEWRTAIYSRTTMETGCPFISGKSVWKGFNDLETVNPKLAGEWHPTKNGNLKPSDVTSGTHQKVWWLFPYDDPKTGKHFDFEWQATVRDRFNGSGCPFLTNTLVWKGFNDLETRNPELVKEWHPTKNGNLKPSDVTISSGKKVWWLLSYDDPKTGKHFDFEWQAVISSRTRDIKVGCPYLSGRAVWKGFNDLETLNPELAKEWHPTKNGSLKPSDVTIGSGKKVWWLLSYDDPKTGNHFDFEWETTIIMRTDGYNCPYIVPSKTERLLYELMKKENISFIPEKTFDDCINIKKLPFDIYLPKHNIIIEADGIQHFKPVEYFGGSLSFIETKERDKIKNQYCKDNQIPLLRIPYTYDPIVDKEIIESIVLNFIKTKEVPKEIINFYKKEKNDYVKLFSY